MQSEHVALRDVTAAGRATTFFVLVAIPEHGVALVAKPPIILGLRALAIVVVVKDELIPLRNVAAAGRATPLVRVAVEEHGLAFVAEAPLVLIAGRRRCGTNEAQQGGGRADGQHALTEMQHSASRMKRWSERDVFHCCALRVVRGSPCNRRGYSRLTHE